MSSLIILSSKEQKSFDEPKELNSSDRKKYFYLSGYVLETLKNLNGTTNKVCFLLQFGYFKNEKKFFSPKRFNEKDIKYVSKKLNIKISDVKVGRYKGETLSRHRKRILSHMNYKAFSKEIEGSLLNEASELLKRLIKPKYIFKKLNEYLLKNKIEIPKYYILSKIVTESIRKYESTLENIVNDKISMDNKIKLNKLIEAPEAYKKLGIKITKHKLTLLKKLNQSIRPKKIEKSIADFKELKELFYDNIELIKSLDLSPEVLKYYANTVLKGDVFNISRKKNENRKFLYLISFINHQFKRYNDSLVDVLLRSVQNNINYCEKEHKELTYLESKTKNSKTKEMIKSLDDRRQSLKDVIVKIKEILNSNKISNNDKILAISKLLSEAEKDKVELENLSDITDELLSKTNNNELLNNILSSSSRRLQNRVSGIIKELVFNKETSSHKLIEAVTYYKEKNGQIKSDVPKDFLEDKEKEIIINSNNKLNISLYKVLLFRYIANGIKSGTLNLKHSYKYQSFDEYLIGIDDWKINRESYIEKADLHKFKNPSKHLDKLAQILDKSYDITNKNIMNRLNNFARFDKNDNLRFSTPKVEHIDTNPLRDLLPENKYIPLSEILSTVNSHSNFINNFEHGIIKYQKKIPSNGAFFAAILSYGCNLNTRLMSKITKNIKESELEKLVNWYFTLSNINEANNSIISFTSNLLLPNYINKNMNKKIHTSSDGQKYNVKGESLNANYSYKYGGHKPAVSAYTFIDNRHLLFHSNVFSSSDREAAYLIDGLMQNDVVKSDIHSTDTHGYTEIIFGATHLLGFSFAPRIKNLKSQVLYSFNKIKDYKDKNYKILPSKYVNTDLIKKHWDDILRMICTIKLRKVTASQLFKRLSSYSKNHPLYRTIKAFGQIIKSIFILKYIDDLKLRQDIQKQLNICEHSNRFSRAVFYGNRGEVSYETREEQEIAESCKRLIKNSIICWNYLYLSQVLANTKSIAKKQKMIEIIKNGMIQTWGHVNMFGEFDFSKEKLKDSVGFDISQINSLEL